MIEYLQRVIAMNRISRTIKYESDLDKGFLKEIASIPGCENIYDCIQCGNCSGICPLSIYMDYTPRRIIAMTREGFKKEVLSSLTIWLCSSCYACTVNCPAEIKITDVMYALKRRAIEEKVYPRRFPIPVLAQAFFDTVRNHGRNTESRVVISLWLKSNILKLFRNATLGLALMRRGRMPFRQEQIKEKKEISAMMAELHREA